MKRTAKPVNVIAYVRVSTDRQELSPIGQRQAIERYAAEQGLTVLATFEDIGVSGTAGLEARPGLASALVAAKKAKASIIVAKRDRLARDSFTASLIERDLRSHKGQVISADGVANGDEATDVLLRSMLDAIAAFEAAQIAARIAAAKAVQRQRRTYVGGRPATGWRVDGSVMVHDTAEQETLSRVRALAAEGASTRGIVRALAAEGRMNRTGKPYVQTQIVRMLKAA